MRRALLTVIILGAVSVSAFGMVTEDIMIPTQGKGLFGVTECRLATYVHKPDDFDPQQKYPVVIISHGTATDSYTRCHTRFDYPHASEYFLQHGFVVVVPMRRGYGGSDGITIADSIGSCSDPHYSLSALEASRDVAAVISYVKSLTYVDTQRILLVGFSSGGFTSLAVASLNIEGVIGVINIAGGQGGASRTESPGHACGERKLIEVMGSFGKAKVPTLWIYSENDPFFRPALAKAMFEDFLKNGGKGRLVIAPPFGHALLSQKEGREIWAPYSDEFLRGLNGGNGGNRAQAPLDAAPAMAVR
ncbi:MAG TPA: alpha/beta fold hydrolase [Thermodesulfovibrionales bacterium]|nr:alpha/beta fold hydrolase [Thermodesulfovibrionales bacterium]